MLKWKKLTSWMCGAMLLGTAANGWAQAPAAEATGARAIVTLERKNAENAAPVTAQQVSAKVDGKPAQVTSWRPFRAQQTDLQLVLLIDDSARTSLGLHLKELQAFLNGLPPTAEVGLAYMQNGTARLLQPFTTNHSEVAATVRLPQSSPGANSSPYFALSDLIKRWPAQTGEGVRREVVMITDGVDRYYGRRYDPDDPYVNAALQDSVRAGVVVYSIYYEDAGLADRLGAGFQSGQNYLIQLAQGTGGQTYYQGTGNPVSLTPYLSQIQRKLENQYELRVAPPSGRRGIQGLKVQVNAPNTKVEAPQRIDLGGAR